MGDKQLAPDTLSQAGLMNFCSEQPEAWTERLTQIIAKGKIQSTSEGNVKIQAQGECVTL